LIEKEWVSFGHQFTMRSGHNTNSSHNSNSKDDEDVSPVFIQFLDCVHQLMQQFPDLFEFNNDLLLFLAHHVYSCMYGSFLVNCEKDAIENCIKYKTVSIWTDVFTNKQKFVNTSYDDKKSNKFILTPGCAIFKLRVWEEYFFRWNPYYVMSNSNKLSSPYV
jgi:hypothetical protein